MFSNSDVRKRVNVSSLSMNMQLGTSSLCYRNDLISEQTALTLLVLRKQQHLKNKKQQKQMQPRPYERRTKERKDKHKHDLKERSPECH